MAQNSNIRWLVTILTECRWYTGAMYETDFLQAKSRRFLSLRDTAGVFDIFVGNVVSMNVVQLVW